MPQSSDVEHVRELTRLYEALQCELAKSRLGEPCNPKAIRYEIQAVTRLLSLTEPDNRLYCSDPDCSSQRREWPDRFFGRDLDAYRSERQDGLGIVIAVTDYRKYDIPADHLSARELRSELRCCACGSPAAAAKPATVKRKKRA